MSTAAVADASAPKKGKKKLLIMIAAVALLLVVGGGGTVFLMKKSQAAAEAEAEAEDGDGAAERAPAKASKKHDAKALPSFVPLEPFTVNLADRDADRYAQVGITLEVTDPQVGDQIKIYMPAIRNNILMALAEKTAGELMDRNGKAKLAEQLRRETAKAMGFELADAEEAESESADKGKAKSKKKKKKAPEILPVSAVHFSNFIIQ